jgi:erythronate-4-phosphate dehydrogenase
MIIAVDEALPYWEQAFSSLGELRLFSGRSPKPEEIRHSDALIVRSVTQVDAALLEGSCIKFIAGASAGRDNVDREYLKARGIGFSYSAGCNADSVSEYILTVLYLVAARRGWDLKNKSLAVIGVGNVGSRVAKKAGALGMKVLLCDPPLQDTTGDSRYLSLDDVLGADILTFHVPLVSGGPYSTSHMLDRKVLDRLTPKQFLLNSARGAVFDSRELKSALQEGRVEGAVLDVWEGEPCVDYALLESLDIGTPHIAGSALGGKIRAAEMAREALCSFFGIRSRWDTAALYPSSRLLSPERGTKAQAAVLSVLLQAFDILGYDSAFRSLRSASSREAAEGFDRLRSKGPARVEFRHFTVELDEQNTDLRGIFSALGFGVTEAKP